MDACESPDAVFHGSYQSVFQNVRVKRASNTEILDISSSKKCGFLQTASRDMRLSKLSPRRGIICCPEKECEGTTSVIQSSTVSKSDTSLSSNGSGRADATESSGSRAGFLRGAESGQKGYGAAEVHKRELGSGRDASVANSSRACSSSTISETARELCRAVSVSLGLAMESSELGEVGPHHAPPQPPLTTESSRDEMYLPVLDCSVSEPEEGAKDREYALATGQRDRGLELRGRDKMLGMFKSGDLAGEVTTLQYSNASRSHLTSGVQEVHEFARMSGDIANLSSEGTAARTAPDAMSGEFTGPVENYVNHYNARIKAEMMPRELNDTWAYPHRYADDSNGQYGPPKQRTTYATGHETPFICNPYEYGQSGSLVARERPPPEQWYPVGMLARPPYPNVPRVKNEVGEWLDVTSLTDGR
ncbi:hypothetical protein PO909_025893 [Leuciscus waleckii]